MNDMRKWMNVIEGDVVPFKKKPKIKSDLEKYDYAISKQTTGQEQQKAQSYRDQNQPNDNGTISADPFKPLDQIQEPQQGDLLPSDLDKPSGARFTDEEIGPDGEIYEFTGGGHIGWRFNQDPEFHLPTDSFVYLTDGDNVIKGEIGRGGFDANSDKQLMATWLDWLDYGGGPIIILDHNIAWQIEHLSELYKEWDVSQSDLFDE